MTNHTPNTVGVDISKAHLDARASLGRIEPRTPTTLPDSRRWPLEGGLLAHTSDPRHRAFEALAETLPLSRVAQALGEHADGRGGCSRGRTWRRRDLARDAFARSLLGTGWPG